MRIKKIAIVLSGLLAMIIFAGCGGPSSSSAQTTDKAQVSAPATGTAPARFATRKLEQGTKIIMTGGGAAITGTLNNSAAAKDLISRLPYRVGVHRYTHDYCGVMDKPLKYEKQDISSGWQDGDIDFVIDGTYFAILYKDEADSKSHGNMVNLGVVTIPLGTFETLPGDLELEIKLAQ